MKEIYVPIEGYEKYEISNMGNVKNSITGKIISQRKSNGYKRVNLRKGNVKYEKPHVANVHRLVAAAFVYNDSPDTKTYVNHIDGNKENNEATNLEWCTARENTLHAIRTGLMHCDYKRNGEITAEKMRKPVIQMDMVGNVINTFDSAADAAKTIHNRGTIETAANCIGKACLNKIRQAYGYKWKFMEVMH